jgi:hypothetical protein
VSGNHALRPDRDTEELQRLIGMKQHPDRQPGGAVAVNSGDYDNRDSDQQFEGNGIQEDRIQNTEDRIQKAAQFRIQNLKGESMGPAFCLLNSIF